MNTTLTGTEAEPGTNDDFAPFTQLLELYAQLGLAPDPADAAAKADLACGWQSAD